MKFQFQCISLGQQPKASSPPKVTGGQEPRGAASAADSLQAVKDPPKGREEGISPEMTRLLTEKMGLTTKEDDTISLYIWDFAGHEMYYTTHQVHLLLLVIYRTLI